MFTWKQVREKTSLDKAIEKLMSEMQEYKGDDPEYPKMVKQLEKLYAMKELEKPDHISYDTAVTVGGTVLAVLIMVMYERTNIMSSKALNFLPRPK